MQRRFRYGKERATNCGTDQSSLITSYLKHKYDIYTLCVGEVDEGSGLSLRAETGEEGGIVRYLAGGLVARRLKPGMLVPFILGLLRVRESLSFVIWGDLPSENSSLFSLDLLPLLPIRNDKGCFEDIAISD